MPPALGVHDAELGTDARVIIVGRSQQLNAQHDRLIGFLGSRPPACGDKFGRATGNE